MQSAALGCASQATVTREVDAPGLRIQFHGHCAVPNAGPAAAATWWWRAMLQAGFPGLYLAQWTVPVSGAVCVVQVTTNLTPPAGSLFVAFDHLAAGAAAKAVVS